MKSARILHHPGLAAIIREARARNLPLYLVGGAVRSLLTHPDDKISNADLLILSEARAFAEQVASILKSRAVIINPHFDTVLIPSGKMELELSGPRDLLRAKRPKVDLPDDPLERDLLLRDFTINAMAIPLSPSKGRLIDPSCGQNDLKERIIRTPISPQITLREDPLRMLRAARLAAQLDFSIAPDLLKAMHLERSSIASVSVERRTAELLKILATPKPSLGLKLLYVTGLLDAAFPEIAAMASLKQNRKQRHKDIFEHTLKVVDAVAQAEGTLHTRIAALLHDIGKPATRRYDAELGWTFHGHEVVGERMAKRLGLSWRLPSATTEKVAKLVRLHMRPINLSDDGVTDSAVRRLGVQAGEDVDELITLCRADVTSSDPRRVKRYLANFEKVVEHLRDVEEKDKLRSFQSPVRGDVIMAETGLEPGPMVGKLKRMIEDAILDGIIPNEYDAALAYLRKIKDAVLENIPEDKGIK